MDHPTQVRVLKELIRQLDNNVNVDAGVMFKSPTSAYTSPETAQKEWDILFKDHPQLIGLTGDLPQAGSFMTIDDFGVPILATRDKEGKFRAFLNACRHRGVALTGDRRGKQSRFTCPFHSWTYASDGRLIAIPQEDQFGDIDKSCYGLVELPAQEKYGLLFVHPKADGAIDVDALLGDLAPEFENWHFEELVYVGESVIEKDLNWKLANDTFGETYHFQKLHRDTLGRLFYGDCLSYEEFGRNHRFTFPSKAIDLMREKPEEEWNIRHAANVLYYLFPNIQFNVGGQNVSLIKIYPHPTKPGTSITRIPHYFPRSVVEASATEPDGNVDVLTSHNVYDRDPSKQQRLSLSAITEVFDSTIEHEDYVMAESTQRAAENGMMDHMIFGRNEPALHHFHNHFRDALGMPPLERFDRA